MGPSSSVSIQPGCDACARRPRWPLRRLVASWVLLLVERFAIVGGSRSQSRLMVAVLGVVVCRHHCAVGIAAACIVAMPLACLFHARIPENSSNDQCHAHDNCNLFLQAGDNSIRGRLHHLSPESLHIHIRPHRNPHTRFDKGSNDSAHVAAPTKNFYFDSHWQQSRSIRSSYILERRHPAGSFPKHLRSKGVVSVVAKWVALIEAAQIHGGLQMGIRPGKELRF
jgi:hypothetical protein